jgi:hypothetical protein
VHKRLYHLDGTEDNPDAYIKARDQFRLDTRSDPATLDGLTLEDVRQLWLEGSGGQPMNAENDLSRAPWRLFFLADAEVLRERRLDKIKVAVADYDPATAVPRLGRQRYFGWIPRLLCQPGRCWICTGSWICFRSNSSLEVLVIGSGIQRTINQVYICTGNEQKRTIKVEVTSIGQLQY